MTQGNLGYPGGIPPKLDVEGIPKPQQFRVRFSHDDNLVITADRYSPFGDFATFYLDNKVVGNVRGWEAITAL